MLKTPTKQVNYTS